MNHNDWLDSDILEDYLDGKLDAKTMHSVERLALEDPFVAEALAGLSQSHRRTTSLSLLQKQLQDRIAQKPVVEKRWRITSQRLSVAAAAAVLFVVASILFWMKQDPKKEQMAGNKKVETNIAPPISQESTDNKVADVPLIAKNDQVAAKQDKKIATLAAVERAPKAIVAEESKQIASSTILLPDTAARPSAAVSNNTTPEMVTLARTKAPLGEVARETVIAGKAEGVNFAPKNQTSQGKAGVLINGIVYEKPGGQPVPGAIVRIPGTNKSTTTNAKGEFSIPADSTSNSLSIAYLGFTSKEVQAKPNQPVSVALEHDNQSLNEVVLTNSDKMKAVRPTPVPAIGWAGFSGYLSTNNKLLPAGTKSTKFVQLTFRVEKDGRPSSVKVKKGLSKVENEEAIRLIKDGPNWTLPANSRREVEVSIAF